MNKELLEYIEKRSDRKNRNLKYDFMPSLLEIIEKPSHIAGHVIIWSVFLIMVFAAVWSYVSKVEVVVKARGTIEPVNEPEILCAEAGYKITDIKAEEGQTVRKGELLAELSAEEQQEELEELEMQIKSVTALVDLYKKIQEGEDIRNTDISAYDKKDWSVIQDIIDEYVANRKMFDQYTSGNLTEQAEELNENYKKGISKELNEKEQEQEELNERKEKLKEDIAASRIYAPFDGIIYRCYIKKEDISVSESQPLFSLVNHESELEMKCYVKNSDVSDIKPDQTVNIKLDSFPYTDYGTISGRVTFISEKAESVEGYGGAFMIKVSVTDSRFDEKLIIGMSGSAEMVVGKRRIIDYFLEPVTGALKESVRER